MGRNTDALDRIDSELLVKSENDKSKNVRLPCKSFYMPAKEKAISVMLDIMLKALRLVVKNDPELLYWQKKTKLSTPDLSDHFIRGQLNPFLEEKMRYLLSAQLKIVDRCMKRMTVNKQKITLADIGDSDGSLRMALKEVYPPEVLDDIGINLQPTAVERLKSRGLKAIVADATDLPDGCGPFNIVTVLETLEHLPNPVLFLENAHNFVKDCLIISVPYVAKSHVSLDYLDSAKWDHSKRKATVESVHIFELNPKDWGKLFQHCGWRVADDFVALQYPRSLVFPLRPLWKHIDFEGFYCVALTKDNARRALYFIE